MLEAELEPAADEPFSAAIDPTQTGTETVNLWEIQMRDFDRDRTILLTFTGATIPVDLWLCSPMGLAQIADF